MSIKNVHLSFLITKLLACFRCVRMVGSVSWCPGGPLPALVLVLVLGPALVLPAPVEDWPADNQLSFPEQGNLA